MKSPRVAIVGATGAVGEIALELLAERKFAFSSLKLFASERSKGRKLLVAGKEYACETLSSGCFSGCDIVFFDASDATSSDWVSEALKAGAWVIDNSSVNRMRDSVTLAVPEVNGHELEAQIRDALSGKREKLIAGPNCSTAALVMSLAPIKREFGLKRVVVSTYQSVSGAGSKAVTELKQSAAKMVATSDAISSQREYPDGVVFPHPIAFSVIPQIGSFAKEGELAGFTSEEIKIREETRKILAMPRLAVFPTAIRVPTIRGHAGSVWVETERPVDLKRLREAVRGHAGLELRDDPFSKDYPVTRMADGTDPVFVGRYRLDPDSGENTLGFWFVSDNLRKGAALNGIQIAEVIARIL